MANRRPHKNVPRTQQTFVSWLHRMLLIHLWSMLQRGEVNQTWMYQWQWVVYQRVIWYNGQKLCPDHDFNAPLNGRAWRSPSRMACWEPAELERQCPTEEAHTFRKLKWNCKINGKGRTNTCKKLKTPDFIAELSIKTPFLAWTKPKSLASVPFYLSSLWSQHGVLRSKIES